MLGFRRYVLSYISLHISLFSNLRLMQHTGENEEGDGDDGELLADAENIIHFPVGLVYTYTHKYLYKAKDTRTNISS